MGRSWSIPLFPVFGIRLELHLTFFLLVLYLWVLGYQIDSWRGASWNVLLGLLLFVCVILHELGHSLTARRYGIQTTRILLLPIGGMAQMTELPRQPSQEFMITIAGPLVNFVLAGLAAGTLSILGLLHWDYLLYVASSGGYTIPDLIILLGALNVIMGVFNLIPVFPMDGGRILRSVLAMRLSYVRATQIAVWVARPLAIAGVLGGLYLGRPLLALLFGFIFLAGDLEYRQIVATELWRHMRIGDAVIRFFRTVPLTITLGEAVALMREEHPPELVLSDGHEVHNALTSEQVLALAREHSAAASLLALAPPPHRLQASWPLIHLARTVSAPDHVYLVYDEMAFLGLLRPERLQEIVAWRHLDRPSSQTRRPRPFGSLRTTRG